MMVGYSPVGAPVITPLDRLFTIVNVLASYNSVAASKLLEAIYMQAKANPASLNDDMRVALFRYVEGTGARGEADATGWVLVPGSSYDPVTGVFSAPVEFTGVYAIGTIDLKQYWMPIMTLR